MLGQYPFLREVLPCPLLPMSLWRPSLPCATWHFLSLIDLRVGTQCRTAKQGSSFPVHGNGFTFGQRTHNRQKVVVSVCQGRGQIFGSGLTQRLKVNKTDRYLCWGAVGSWIASSRGPVPRDPSHGKLSRAPPRNHPCVEDNGQSSRLLLPLMPTSFPVHPILRFLNKWAPLLYFQTMQKKIGMQKKKCRKKLDNFSGVNRFMIPWRELSVGTARGPQEILYQLWLTLSWWDGSGGGGPSPTGCPGNSDSPRNIRSIEAVFSEFISSPSTWEIRKQNRGFSQKRIKRVNDKSVFYFWLSPPVGS